jgi:hypothetical protein
LCRKRCQSLKVFEAAFKPKEKQQRPDWTAEPIDVAELFAAAFSFHHLESKIRLWSNFRSKVRSAAVPTKEKGVRVILRGHFPQTLAE